MVAPIDARSKVVVRKLPPGITEEEVRVAIDGVSQGKYDWFSFVPGKISLKRIRHSRLYLNFSDPAEVYKFRAQFSGHAFVNKKGAQYKCTVEFAPYQKVPREKAKEDSREGTYEKDADFIAFKQQMEGEPEMLPSAEAQLDAKEQERKAALVAGVPETRQPKITPLMQFLYEKHSIKPEKKATILVPIRKKSSKPQTLPLPRAASDADLPPHMASKSAASQATASKPPRAQQPAASAKPTHEPNPISQPPGYSQSSPGNKGKKQQDQQARDAAAASAAESAASSRSATPSGKARQPDSRAASPAAEGAKSPAVPRKVVPIPLDRLAKRDNPRTDSRNGASQGAQPAAGSQQADAKPGRKVRPGFQTWTPRRGRADSPIEEEAGSDSALDAAKAAAAAALGAAQAQGKDASEGDTDSFGPSQPPGSGWDNDIPPQKPEPASTRSTGRGNTASSRGRGSNHKGREPSAVTPEPARNAPETGGGRPADAGSSTMPGATWDEDVPVPVPSAQGPAMHQQESRGRGQGRGRGRGRGRGGYGNTATQPDLPPGAFGNSPVSSSHPGAGPSAAPRTVLIKKRPQPGDASVG